MRLFQATTSSTGTVTPGYYTYNNHSDVEAVTGTNGNTTATYGYTANITSMFTGADKNNTSPGPAVQPYSSYRYNAMRWDPGSGQYDMGFRNYDSGLNAFTSRDMYDGALADASLTTDPFTGSRYAFGAGNPISNIELDGHTQCDAGYCPTAQQTEQVTQRAASYGAGCPYGTIGCPGYHPPSTTTSSGGGCSGLSCVGHWFSASANWLGTQGTNLLGGAVNGPTDFASLVGTPFRWLGAKLVNSMPTGATASGQLTFTNHASDAVRQSPWNVGNRNSIAYKIGYYGWPLLFPPAAEEDAGAAAVPDAGAASGGWGLDSLSQSGGRLVGNQGMTKAGASLVQHAGELGYNQIGGSVAARNVLGQDLLDEILTNPGTVESKVTSGNFAGGVRFISPTYAGATFNSSGVFQYFGYYGP